MKTAKVRTSIGRFSPGRRRPNGATRGILGAEVGPIAGARACGKWAWHKGVLLALRDRMLKERAEQLAEAAAPLEPHSQSPADSASDEFEHDIALGRLSAEQDALFEIEEALGRIRAGTYGVCEETGRPIPAPRLRAIPWTRFSREVEARLEREGAVARPRIGSLASVRESGAVDLRETEPEDDTETAEAPGSGDSGQRRPLGSRRDGRVRACFGREKSPVPRVGADGGKSDPTDAP